MRARLVQYSLATLATVLTPCGGQDDGRSMSAARRRNELHHKEEGKANNLFFRSDSSKRLGVLLQTQNNESRRNDTFQNTSYGLVFRASDCHYSSHSQSTRLRRVSGRRNHSLSVCFGANQYAQASRYLYTHRKGIVLCGNEAAFDKKDVVWGNRWMRDEVYRGGMKSTSMIRLTLLDAHVFKFRMCSILEVVLRVFAKTFQWKSETWC